MRFIAMVVMLMVLQDGVLGAVNRVKILPMDPVLVEVLFPPTFRSDISSSSAEMDSPKLLDEIGRIAMAKTAHKPTDQYMGIQGSDQDLSEILSQTFPSIITELLPEEMQEVAKPAATRFTSATARSQFHSESVFGDIYFAESKTYKDSHGRPKTVVSGRIDGLEPGKEYSLKIHKSGDTRQACSRVGIVEFESKKMKFTTGSDGRAAFVFQVEGVPVGGDINIAGRSLVLHSPSSTVCSVITRVD